MNSQDNPVDELSELIAMAEKSSEHIDFLTDALARVKMSIIGIAVALGACLSFLSLRFDQFDQFGRLDKYGVLSLAVLMLSSGFFLAYARMLKMRRLFRDKLLEQDIAARLISLIEGLFSSIRRSEMVSPVTLATFEIRIRRLNRVGGYNV